MSLHKILRFTLNTNLINDVITQQAIYTNRHKFFFTEFNGYKLINNVKQLSSFASVNQSLEASCFSLYQSLQYNNKPSIKKYVQQPFKNIFVSILFIKYFRGIVFILKITKLNLCVKKLMTNLFKNYYY